MDNKEFVRLAKKKILKCLTENFTYGKRKDGTPLKRPHRNYSIFDKEEGFAEYTKTDLSMVMDKVVLGLYFALAEMEENDNG